MQDRAQQLAIIQRMVDAGESEQNIATVIQSFTRPTPTPTSRATGPRIPAGELVKSQLTQNLGDILIGALKGGGETAINLGSILHKVPGVSALVDKLYGQEGLSAGAFDAAKQAYTQPTNTAQSIGKGVEQVAELFGAGGVVNAATRTIPRLAGRMAAEGAAGAAMNMAQGQSATAGGVVGAAVPALGAGVRSARALFAGAGASQPVREAVEWGVSRGIPVDAATATGAPIVRAIQGASDATPLGGLVASRARNQADEALTRTGREIADQVSPKAQDMLTAGESIQGSLAQKIQAASKEADDAYEALRKIESTSGAPRRLTTLVTDVSPDIQKVIPSPPGTPFRQLRREEQDAIRAMQAETNIQQFDAGGVVDTGAGEFSGGAASMGGNWVDSSASAKAYQAQKGSNLKQVTANADAMKDSGTTLSGANFEARLLDYMKGGKTTQTTDRALRVAQRMLGMVDDVATENPLRRGTGASFQTVSHPITKTAVETGTTDVLKAVEDTLATHGIRAGSPQFDAITSSDDIPELLRIVGGMRESGAGNNEITRAVKAAVTELIDFTPPTMAMVVDLAPARERLKPVYQRMMQARQIAEPMGAEAKALKAIDRLMTTEGQHAPLSIVDDALSDLKSVVRSSPDKLGKGAGALNSVVASLDAQVMAAAKRAGPEAVKALQDGRAATVRKYIAADLADRLGAEPARAAGKLVTRADTSIGLLRDLAKQSPESLPEVGRAVVDDLLEMATNEGGFKRGQGLFERWTAMGEETKSLLFKPELKKDLDRFFLLAKRMGESPNPSQSATLSIGAGSGVMTFMNPATGIPLVLGAGALSKLLHSQKGAQMLSNVMSTPNTSPAYPGLLSNLTRVAGLEASQAIGGGR